MSFEAKNATTTKSYYCGCGIEVASKVAVVIQLIMCLGANIVGLVFAIICLVCLCCPSKGSYKAMRNVAIAQCVFGFIGTIIFAYLAFAPESTDDESSILPGRPEQSTLIGVIIFLIIGVAHSAYAARICNDYRAFLKNKSNTSSQVHPGFHPHPSFQPQMYQGNPKIDAMPYPMYNQPGYPQAQQYQQQQVHQQGPYGQAINVQTVV